MPPLSRLYVRTALIYLFVGFTFGGLILANKGVPFAPELWRWLSVHIEFVLLGWMAQLAMGVAFWILPRWGTSRGDTRPAWVAYVLLNCGILLAALAPVWGAPSEVVALGRVAQALAGAAFAWHAWPRVKALGA